MSDLRKSLPFLNESRIASAGEHWLYGNGAEPTLLDRLFGASLAHAVPLHYHSMVEERVLEEYDLWLNCVNKQIEDSPFTVARLARESRIGSARCPKLKVVGTLLRHYRELTSWHLANSRSLVDSHNRFVAYTHLMLALATGLRPVHQPFESLRDFCTETSTFFISDKESRRVPSPRFIPVAEFATKQLHYYFSYLQELSSYMGMFDYSSRYMQGVMAGQTPFLFTLSEDFEPSPLSPGKLSEILGEHFPLVPNWNRHLLRTELCNRGIADEVVQAFLGHGLMGQEPLARYSALSMADLQHVALVINEIACAIGVEPLASAPHWVHGDTSEGSPTQSNIPSPFPTQQSSVHYQPQREKNAEKRKQESQRQAAVGLSWASEKCKEIRKNAKKFQDGDYAKTWQEETTRQLKKTTLSMEHAWTAGRHQLCKQIDALNRELGLEIPVPAPPKRIRPRRPLRDQAMFSAHRMVQKAASAFERTFAETNRFAHASNDQLLPLILFSAACCGGLGEPKALLALGRALQRKQVQVIHTESLGACWIDIHHETDKRNNVLVDGDPQCLRRFYLDGTTLVLLVRFLKKQDRRASSFYKDQTTLMKRIREAVNQICEAKIPSSLTLSQLTKGAIAVAERRPGVRLPNHLAEYACGVTDSVSLPHVYLQHYIGGSTRPRPESATIPQVRLRNSREVKAKTDPDVDRSIQQLRSLFQHLPKHDKRKQKEVLIQKFTCLLGQCTSPTLEAIVNWLKYHLARGLKPSSVRRYSCWIGSRWLIEFDGINLAQLTPESWYSRYSYLIENAPKPQRPDIAARLDDFHEFLVGTYRFPAIPSALRYNYRKKTMVRPRVIPERTFTAFKKALLSSDVDDSRKEAFLWIFVLCYRLGTRIGETTRLLMSDIEGASDPCIMFRANRFGSTKTQLPHQLQLNPFLPKQERRAFHNWLDTQRVLKKSQRNALLFAPPHLPSLLWDPSDLGSLFTELMYQVSGMHFSPHDCRHSAACRLIWLAEKKPSPDPSFSTAYTLAEQKELHDAVFTTNKSRRDRIRHLSAVFNHLSPETTLGDYVHFLDLLLYLHLAESARRVPARTLASLLACPKKTLTASEHCNNEGYLIGQVLPIVHEFNKAHFHSLEIPLQSEPNLPSSADGEIESYFSRPDLVALAQIILEEIEGGEEPKVVAIRYGARLSWVSRIHQTAIRLNDVFTREGSPRLFSKSRRRPGRPSLAPTRLREAEDQELAIKLIPALRKVYRTDKDTIIEACKYWLAHTTTSNSALKFNSPDQLKQFLRCFIDANAIPNSRWLVLVSASNRAARKTMARDWAVFPKVEVRIQAAAAKSAEHPNGIASLHLQKRRVTRKDATKDTSKLIKYILHMLAILLDVDLRPQSFNQDTSEGIDQTT